MQCANCCMPSWIMHVDSADASAQCPVQKQDECKWHKLFEIRHACTATKYIYLLPDISTFSSNLCPGAAAVVSSGTRLALTSEIGAERQYSITPECWEAASLWPELWASLHWGIAGVKCSNKLCWLCKKCVFLYCDDTGLLPCFSYAVVHLSVFTRSLCKAWHMHVRCQWCTSCSVDCVLWVVLSEVY